MHLLISDRFEYTCTKFLKWAFSAVILPLELHSALESQEAPCHIIAFFWGRMLAFTAWLRPACETLASAVVRMYFTSITRSRLNANIWLNMSNLAPGLLYSRHPPQIRFLNISITITTFPEAPSRWVKETHLTTRRTRNNLFSWNCFKVNEA